ncbi:MAG: class I SAM-dependent methyltransferase [Actinomycetota bacterium]
MVGVRSRMLRAAAELLPSQRADPPAAPDTSEMVRTAAAHWTRETKEGPCQARTRWWQHPVIVRHVNKSICGAPVDGRAAGDVSLLERRLQGRVFESAISVGCGTGGKEMALLRANLVTRFDLYEISDARIQRGKELADRHGLRDRITWHNRVVDFESDALDGEYDLVYWNNALHHMLDVDQAVQWSKRALRRGGYLYVNDFVGPNRMQWSDEALAIGSRARELLPRRLLKRPNRRGYFARSLRRLPPDAVAATDPTECADSDDILPAIRRHFPAAWIKPTGGTIYHAALNDIVANFTDEDTSLLEFLLLLDDACTAAGHTHYAVALAPRDRRSTRRKRVSETGKRQPRPVGTRR